MNTKGLFDKIIARGPAQKDCRTFSDNHLDAEIRARFAGCDMSDPWIALAYENAVRAAHNEEKETTGQ